MTTQLVVTESTELTRTRVPALPVAPVEYSRLYHDQLNNILRLYFNTLDNFVAQLNVSAGGSGTGLYLPYGAFHQDGTTTLSADMTNTSTAAIQVASTAGFPSSGWLLIESELIGYTSKTATTFDGTITRGVFGTTNVAHTAGVYITEAQGVASVSSVGQVLLNFTDESSGVATDPLDQTKVVFTYGGIYNIQFSAQLLNFTTTEDNVTIWARLDGVDVPVTAGVEQVNSKHGSNPGAAIAGWNYVLSVDAGQYFQLVWSSITGDTVIATFPPGTSPTRPASPGMILTATFVSAV